MTIQLNSMGEIKKLATETMRKLGVVVPLDISFNGRFTSRLGDARWRNGKGRVRLSKPLWTRATPEERRETVIHEVCHIVQGKKYPFSSSHGREWAGLMRECGLPPRRYHTVDRTGLRKTTTVSCGCSSYEFGAVRIKKMHAGTKYKCLKCRGEVKEVKVVKKGSPAPTPSATSGAQKVCPKCGVSGEVGAVFGWRTMSGKQKPQSYCRSCRKTKGA